MIVLSIVMPALLWTLEAPAAMPLLAAQEPMPVVAQRADPPPDAGREAAAEATRAPERPVYVPSRRGAPERRVPAAVRNRPKLARPMALAPPWVAETLSPQPALLWDLDVLPTEPLRVLFTLVRPDEIDPVAEVDLGEPQRAGIHWIRLQDLGVTLEAGVEYQWAISLVDASGIPEPGRITLGWIQRVAPPPALAAGSPVGELAGRGFWYEAIAGVQREVESGSRPALFKGYRDELLRDARVLDPVLE